MDVDDSSRERGKHWLAEDSGTEHEHHVGGRGAHDRYLFWVAAGRRGHHAVNRTTAEPQGVRGGEIEPLGSIPLREMTLNDRLLRRISSVSLRPETLFLLPDSHKIAAGPDCVGDEHVPPKSARQENRSHWPATVRAISVSLGSRVVMRSRSASPCFLTAHSNVAERASAQVSAAVKHRSIKASSGWHEAA